MSPQQEALFTVVPFSGKSIVIGIFMFQETVSMNFFIDCCMLNFFFIIELVCFHNIDWHFDLGS